MCQFAVDTAETGGWLEKTGRHDDSVLRFSQAMFILDELEYEYLRITRGKPENDLVSYISDDRP